MSRTPGIFFAPELYKGGKEDKGRWFVYYYTPPKEGVKSKRVKVYRNFAKIADPYARYVRALQVMDDIARLYGTTTHSVLTETLEKYKLNYRLKTYSSLRSIISNFPLWLKSDNDKNVTPLQAEEFLLLKCHVLCIKVLKW